MTRQSCYVLLMALVLWVGEARAQEDTDPMTAVRRHLQAATEALSGGKYRQAIEAYELALGLSDNAELPKRIQAVIKKQAHYNMACCHARLKQADDAIASFKKALDHGFRDFEHMDSDPDLDFIRKDERFLAALEKLRGAAKLIDKEMEQRIEQARRELSKEALFAFTFKGQEVEGKGTIDLSALKGRVVIVSVWSSLVAPSHTMIPGLGKLAKKHSDILTVLGLAYERGDDAEKRDSARRAKLRLKMSYDSATIGDGVIDQIKGFSGFPTTLLIDRQGRVRRMWVGVQNLSTLEAFVLALSKGESAAKPKAKVKEQAKKAPKTPAKLYEEGPY